MVEFLMVFALGVLATMALALLALPALSHRADRLARRRMEALYPGSITEIVAERDHVRAQMAVDNRKTELEAEAIAKQRASDMAEIGRRDVLIHQLKQKLARRESEIARLKTELTETRASLDTTKTALEDTKTALGERSAALDLLNSSHAGLKSAHDQTSGELSQTRAHLRLTGEELEEARRQVDERSTSYLALEKEHLFWKATAAERLVMLVAHESKIENLTHDLLDAKRRLAAAKEEIETLKVDALERKRVTAENAALSARIEALALAFMQRQTKEIRAEDRQAKWDLAQESRSAKESPPAAASKPRSDDPPLAAEPPPRRTSRA